MPSLFVCMVFLRSVRFILIEHGCLARLILSLVPWLLYSLGMLSFIHRSFCEQHFETNKSRDDYGEKREAISSMYNELESAFGTNQGSESKLTRRPNVQHGKKCPQLKANVKNSLKQSLGERK